MPLLIAPFSCRHAAYTAGRSENARVKFGRYPNPALSVAYSSAVAPVAWPSGTVSIKAIAAPLGLCRSRPANADPQGNDPKLAPQARLVESRRGDLAGRPHQAEDAGDV